MRAVIANSTLCCWRNSKTYLLFAFGFSHRLIHTLLGLLTRSNYTLSTSPISASELGALIDAVTSQRMTGTEAKTLVADFLSAASSSSTSAPTAAPTPTFESQLANVLESRPVAGPAQSGHAVDSSPSPSSAAADPLSALVADVIASHPDEVAKIRKGQLKVVKRLVGESMKRSRGRADAKKVEEMLLERLTGDQA